MLLYRLSVFNNAVGIGIVLAFALQCPLVQASIRSRLRTVSLKQLPVKWPWDGRDEIQQAKYPGVPLGPRDPAASIPNYRPPEGVRPKTEDGLVRITDKLCPNMGCGDVCKEVNGEAQPGGLKGCSKACSHLADQCCNFCYYGSYSFAFAEMDSNAPRRQCLDSCPGLIRLEMSEPWVAEPDAVPVPPIASAVPPIASAIPPIASAIPPISSAASPNAALPAAPYAALPAAPYAAAPGAIPAGLSYSTMPFSSQSSTPAQTQTTSLAPSGKQPVAPLPQCEGCTGPEDPDSSASLCRKVYEQCVTNCIVAPADTKLSNCKTECQGEACNSMLQLGATEVPAAEPIVKAEDIPLKPLYRMPCPPAPSIRPFPQATKAKIEMGSLLRSDVQMDPEAFDQVANVPSTVTIEPRSVNVTAY